MKVTARELFSRLRETMPEAAPLIDEHISDNFGEILPHLLLSDFARKAAELLQVAGDGRVGARQSVDRLLKLLEWAHQFGDPYTVNAIDASFVESLPDADEPGSEIRSMLGPSLSRSLRNLGH